VGLPPADFQQGEYAVGEEYIIVQVGGEVSLAVFIGS
jgi:hypothetical protein